MPSIILIFIASSLHAQQWQYSSSNAYYSGGNVGIGTASPSAIFEVNTSGNNALKISSSDHTSIHFVKASATDYGTVSFFTGATRNYFMSHYNDGTFRISREGTNHNDFVLASSGNFGIGTTNPASRLEVSAPITGADKYSIISRPNNNYTDRIVGFFHNANGNEGGVKAYSELYLKTEVNGIAFEPAGIERMRITPSGNVGIGTASPATKFHVVSGNNTFRFNDGIDNAGPNLSFGTSAGKSVALLAGTAGAGLAFDQTGYFGIFKDSKSNIDGGITTGQNALLTVTNGGNMGIGTPNPQSKLHVVSVNNSFRFNDGPANELPNLSIGTNPGKSVALLAGTAGTGLAFDQTGYFGIFKDSKSNIDGGNTTGQNALVTVTNGGDMGIGTSSPSNRLDVNGNIKATGFILPTGAATGKVLTSDANGNATWQTGTGSSSGWAFNGNTVQANKSIGTIDNYNFSIITGNAERIKVLADGRVTIGAPVSIPSTDAKLAVYGGIYSTKVKVTQNGWADYVFDAGYPLRPLSEVEQYIQKHHHLPEVPSAAEVEKAGLDLGDNQATLLKKIEELTLYIIEQNKQIQKLSNENKELSELKKEVKEIQALLKKN